MGRSVLRRRSQAAIASAVVSLALLLAVPVGSVGAATVPTRTSAPAIILGPLQVTVTWNGENISNAKTVGTAFSLNEGKNATVRFSLTGEYPETITNVTVELLYLGLVLTTSRAGISGDSAVVNWSFGSVSAALQGVFQLRASVLTAGGSVAWSQGFYVISKTPYSLESGAVVVLILLAIAEVYWGASAIREARRTRKPPSGPSPTPGSGGPSAGSTPGSTGPPPAAPTGAPPPSAPGGTGPTGPGSSGGGGP